MSTKTINLTDGAYSRLAALKHEGESFSDVVNRITGKFALLELVGVLDESQANALRATKRGLGRRLRKGMNEVRGR